MHLVGFFYKNTPPLWGSSITLRRTTFVRAPLDEWSACRRDPYLTIHNTRKRQTSMPAAKFKLAISASESPQTHPSDRAATMIGCIFVVDGKLNVIFLTVRIYGHKVSPATLPYSRVGKPFWGRVPKSSINFEEILSRAHGDFEEQFEVLESSINYY